MRSPQQNNASEADDAYALPNIPGHYFPLIAPKILSQQTIQMFAPAKPPSAKYLRISFAFSSNLLKMLSVPLLRQLTISFLSPLL
jgi:hypothetical protein